MRKLIIDCAIEKSNQVEFSGEGVIYSGCPRCGYKILIQLHGLPNDKTLSPIVNITDEWSPDEEEEPPTNPFGAVEK